MIVRNRPTTVAITTKNDVEIITQVFSNSNVPIHVPQGKFPTKGKCKICGDNVDHMARFDEAQNPARNVACHLICICCGRVRTVSLPLNEWNKKIIREFELED